MNGRTGRTDRTGIRPGTVGAVGVATIVTTRVVTEVVRIVRASELDLVARLPDDAFYYLGVARSWARGRGPSFDGVHPTNGFQPLWQWIEVGLAHLASGGPLVRVALLVQVGLVVAGWAVLARVASRHLGSAVPAAAMAVVLASPPLWSRLVDGMESALSVATAASLVWACDRWSTRPGRWDAALVGGAAGLVVLTRLSALPAVLLVPALLWWRTARRPGRPDRRQAGRHLVAGLVAMAVVLLPWVGSSWGSVGRLTPVSATVKLRTNRDLVGPPLGATSLRRAERSLAEEVGRQVDAVVPVRLSTATGLRRALVAGALVGLVGLGVAAGRRRSGVAVLLGIVPLLGVRLAVDTFWLAALVPSWYGAPLAGATAVVVGAALAPMARRLPRRRASTRWLAVAAALAGSTLVVLQPDEQPTGDWGRANAEAAAAVGRVAPGARVGAFDAGALGWLHPGTRNLDGLVREPAFVERLGRGIEPAELLRSEGIDVLVALDHDGRIPTCGRLRWRSETRVARPDGPASVGIYDVTTC